MAEFAKDPLLSFVVPVYKVPVDVFKRCLMSLDDQDYPEIEVICVFDGVDPELLNVAVPYLKSKKVRVLEIPHAGACAARNAGFKESKGEIVSFFNSDYIAKPGMARMWADSLKNNPDCGFAYGAYEYAVTRRSMYPSKPFDPWLLKIANYIDCGFPLWRKHVVEWDVNCQSLQDWDFWLRVVKGKCSELPDKHDPLCVGECQPVKGFFLGREISFIAEAPRPKGLSYDSANNWIERVHYVKAKNGIPEPDICVASLGAPNHAQGIAKLLGADFRDDTIYKPHQYKALYLIGWYMKPTDQGNEHPTVMMAFQQPGVKRLLHFVGADVYWLRKFNYETLKALSGAIKLKADHILCETELAQKELADFGIKAEILPVPSYSDWELTPLPEKFSVAIFLTDHNDFDKYCFEHTLSIVRAMPDVQFNVYGDRAKEIIYPNMKHYGNLARPDWEQFVYQNSCLLRMVRHDTLPMSSCEFLMAGRDVISNIPHPYVEYINTAGNMPINDWDTFGPGLNPSHWPQTKVDIIHRIRAVKKKAAGNFLATERIDAREHYLKILDKTKYRERIQELALGKEVVNANV